MPWEVVVFSATFLRSLGWADSRADLRGYVISKNDDPLWLVPWRGETAPRHVNKHNLVSLSRPGGLQADVENCKIWGLNENTRRY